MSRELAPPVVVLVAISVALGLLTSGTPQVVGVLAASFVFIEWVSRRARLRERGVKLPRRAWLWVILAVVASVLLTAPFLAYASLGIANAVFVLMLGRYLRRG